MKKSELVFVILSGILIALTVVTFVLHYATGLDKNYSLICVVLCNICSFTCLFLSAKAKRKAKK